MILDVFGAAVFGQLFFIMLPRRWWREDAYLFCAALIKLALAAVFFWLLLTDLASLSDAPWFGWLAEFPTRGLGLRLLLIVPGACLLQRILR